MFSSKRAVWSLYSGLGETGSNICHNGDGHQKTCILPYVVHIKCYINNFFFQSWCGLLYLCCDLQKSDFKNGVIQNFWPYLQVLVHLTFPVMCIIIHFKFPPKLHFHAFCRWFAPSFTTLLCIVKSIKLFVFSLLI